MPIFEKKQQKQGLNGKNMTVKEMLTEINKSQPEIPLKNCPFCGGKVALTNIFMSYKTPGKSYTRYEIGCGNCDYRFIEKDDYKHIVKRWNTRKRGKNDSK